MHGRLVDVRCNSAPTPARRPALAVACFDFLVSRSRGSREEGPAEGLRPRPRGVSREPEAEAEHKANLRFIRGKHSALSVTNTEALLSEYIFWNVLSPYIAISGKALRISCSENLLF